MLLIPLQPRTSPFPYTTLFRSPQTEASPLMQRRQRSVEVLMPVIGRVGVQVCSTLTDGAGPERVAHGQVVAVHDERIQVRRSEEHTSELQSRGHLVCRLLLEKK